MLPPGLQTSFCPNKPSLTTLKKKKKIKCAGSSIRPFSGLCCIPQGCLLPALAGPLCGAFGLCSKWKNRTEGAGSHFWSPENPALNSDDTTGPRSLQAQAGEQRPYGRQWGSLLWPFPHPCHRQVRPSFQSLHLVHLDEALLLLLSRFIRVRLCATP